MPRILTSSFLVAAFTTVAMSAVPQQARISIDRITGGKGAYVADDGAYKVVFLREEATIAVVRSSPFFERLVTALPIRRLQISLSLSLSV